MGKVATGLTMSLDGYIAGPKFRRGCTGLRSAALGRADRAQTKELQPMSITTVLAAVPVSDTERRPHQRERKLRP